MTPAHRWIIALVSLAIVLADRSPLQAQQLVDLSITAPDRDYHYTAPPAPVKSATFNIPGKGWLKVDYEIDPWPGPPHNGGGLTWGNTGKSNTYAGPGEDCRAIVTSPDPKVPGQKYRASGECRVGPMTGVVVALAPMHAQTWTEGGHQAAGRQRVTITFRSGDTPVESVIFQHETTATVRTGSPTRASTFTLTASWTITQIRTYHWNDGRGTAAPGFISLKGPDGTVYGPWRATGIPGQGGVPNVNWEVRPNVALPPGTYQVVDSDPSTWAHNADTGGAGIIWVFGTAAR